MKCSNYLSKHIIPAINKPFILAMDEVERVFWELRSKMIFLVCSVPGTMTDHMILILPKWIFSCSSSTEPQLFIDNPNQSPFNVAQPIILYDFGTAEIQELNQRHPSPLTPNQLADLTNLLNGHPFLTRLTLYLIATGQYNFSSLQQAAILEDGPFGSRS